MGVRAEQAARARARIIAAAEGLFASKGYDATSLQAIASAAGVQKANVYHYFRTKESILDAALGSAVASVQQLLAAAAKVPRGEQRARFLIEGYVELLVSRRAQQPWILSRGQQWRDRLIRAVIDQLTDRAAALVFDGPLTLEQQLLISQLLALQDAIPRLADADDDRLRAMLRATCDTLLATPGVLNWGPAPTHPSAGDPLEARRRSAKQVRSGPTR